MEEREPLMREDEIDILFRKANFAAEDRGFRERLRARLLARMKEMSGEVELDEEELSGLAAAGQNYANGKRPEMLKKILLGHVR